MTAPKVFISYSHESPEHADRVLQLANKLRSEGIDCILDQYETSPSEGWPRWMDRNIQSADFVLMICTQTYFKRLMGKEKPRTGLGVRWEGKLIYQHLYNEDANKRFIPILFEENTPAQIPKPLQDATYYHPSTPDGYEGLYRRITNQPYTTKPELGKLKSLPPRERKPDFLGTETSPGKHPSISPKPREHKPDFLDPKTSLASPPSTSPDLDRNVFKADGEQKENKSSGLRVWWNKQEPEVRAALIGGIFTLITGLLILQLSSCLGKIPIPIPTPPLTCITADDILVKFRILRGDEVIGTLSSRESISLEPGVVVDFKVEITSIKDDPLPEFEYTWTNTGITTGGELLHSAGRNVDYRSGQDIVDDAISVQLSQSDCLALAPYPFFILPNKE